MKIGTTLCLALTLAIASCSSHSAHEAGKTSSLANNALLVLPRVATSVSGDELLLTTVVGGKDHAAAFEPLAAGYSYHAWARAGSHVVSLGAFTPGEPLRAASHGASQVLVTIEETAAAPASPSATVVVEGDAGGELAFGGLTALAFSEAGGEARVVDGLVELSYSHLPVLLSGYAYHLWVTEGGAGHDPHQSAGHAVQHTGRIDGAGSGHMAPATLHEMPANPHFMITIEAEAGREDMSSLACLMSASEHTP